MWRERLFLPSLIPSFLFMLISMPSPVMHFLETQMCMRLDLCAQGAAQGLPAFGKGEQVWNNGCVLSSSCSRLRGVRAVRRPGEAVRKNMGSFSMLVRDSVALRVHGMAHGSSWGLTSSRLPEILASLAIKGRPQPGSLPGVVSRIRCCAVRTVLWKL